MIKSVQLLITAAFVAFNFSACSSLAETVPASDLKIQITGRCDKTDPDEILFAFPGVSIKAKFEGTEISAVFKEYGSGEEGTTNYFNVIIDNGTPSVLKLSSSDTVYLLASGLSEGPHSVEIIKRTESMVGMVGFQGFILDEGKQLLELDKPSELKMEFVGNSITCGYGNELSTTSPDNYHFTSVNEDNYKAWGAVTARRFGAQYVCTAYSGRGVFRNITGDTLGTIPLIYDQIIADDSTKEWDHSNYIPDIVVVNLGTNDFNAEVSSDLYTVDSAVFVDTYIQFVAKLRSYYPDASIICSIGTMMSDSYPTGAKHWTRIQKYVTAVSDHFITKGDSSVYYFKMSPQSSPYGEDWHPSAATHEKMADKLVDFIEQNIGWEEVEVDEEPTSVSIEDDSFVIYPMPIKSEFTIKTNKQYSKLEIVDLDGAVVFEAEYNSTGTYSLDLSSGVYFLKIKVGGNTETKKIRID